MTDELTPGLHEALVTEALRARIERAREDGWFVDLEPAGDADLASILAVYRCLVTHLAVFGVEIGHPDLAPELCADYAVAPAIGEARGKGGDGAMDRLVAMRTEARKAKDFAKADAIRKLLAEAGVEIEDTPTGPRWTAR